jgi:hypothetical protein
MERNLVFPDKKLLRLLCVSWQDAKANGKI